MVRSVLFVCLGNICRSPTAEGVFRAQAAKAGLAVKVDSAGLADWNIGNPPHGPAIRAAAARGYDLCRQRARQVSGSDFNHFDLILGMDADNTAGLKALRPPGNETPVRLFPDYAPETGSTEVPDPYFTGDFDGALDLVEAAARGLISDLQRQLQDCAGAAAGYRLPP